MSFAFGSSGTSFNSGVSFSYITGVPDTKAVTPPARTVLFKNLLKRDASTREKAISELLTQLQAKNPETLDKTTYYAWIQLYAKLAIDISRVVRDKAHRCQGYICSILGPQSVPHLGDAICPWLLGTVDSDRQVAMAAMQSLDIAFPDPEKRGKFLKTFRKSCVTTLVEALRTETKDSLSDDRFVTKEEADAKFNRFRSSGIALLGNLLPFKQSELDEGCEDILHDDKLWNSVTSDDSALAQAVITLASKMITDDSLHETFSNTLLRKGLGSINPGCISTYTKLITKLTVTNPEIWSMAKKPLTPQLSKYLRTSKAWNEIPVLIEAINRTSLATDMDKLMADFLSGVTSDESPGAWICFFDTIAKIANTSQLGAALSQLGKLKEIIRPRGLCNATLTPTGQMYPYVSNLARACHSEFETAYNAAITRTTEKKDFLTFEKLMQLTAFLMEDEPLRPILGPGIEAIFTFPVEKATKALLYPVNKFHLLSESLQNKFIEFTMALPLHFTADNVGLLLDLAQDMARKMPAEDVDKFFAITTDNIAKVEDTETRQNLLHAFVSSHWPTTLPDSVVTLLEGTLDHSSTALLLKGSFTDEQKKALFSHFEDDLLGDPTALEDLSDGVLTRLCDGFLVDNRSILFEDVMFEPFIEKLLGKIEELEYTNKELASKLAEQCVKAGLKDYLLSSGVRDFIADLSKRVAVPWLFEACQLFLTKLQNLLQYDLSPSLTVTSKFGGAVLFEQFVGPDELAGVKPEPRLIDEALGLFGFMFTLDKIKPVDDTLVEYVTVAKKYTELNSVTTDFDFDRYAAFASMNALSNDLKTKFEDNSKLNGPAAFYYAQIVADTTVPVGTVNVRKLVQEEKYTEALIDIVSRSEEDFQQTLSYLASEIPSVSALEIEAKSGFNRLVLINCIFECSEYELDIPLQRLSMMTNTLFDWCLEAENAFELDFIPIRAEIAKLILHLEDQDVSRDLYEKFLSFVIEGLNILSSLDKDTIDGDIAEIVDGFRLQLFKILATYFNNKETNPVLAEVWKEEIDSVWEDLAGHFCTYVTSPSPLAVKVDRLLGRIAVHVPIKYFELDKLFGVVARSSPDCQFAATKLALKMIPDQQEELSINVELAKTKVASEHDDEDHNIDVTLSPELRSVVESAEPGSSRFLLAWILILDHLDASSYAIKQVYLDQLKSSDAVNDMLTCISEMVQTNPSTKNHTAFPKTLDLSVLAAHLYYRALVHLGSITRLWFADIKKRSVALAVKETTKKHFSPQLIEDEMERVEELLNKASLDDSMSVRFNKQTHEVRATYLVDEQKMEISIVIPDDYPLSAVTVEGAVRVGVRENKWRAWLLASQAIVANKNGTIVDALELFKKNISLHFSGVTECAICYSILHQDKSLPSKTCGTCKNKFHSDCLYKWFKSSNSSTCPLCRSTFSFRVGK
ncbi:hypothetical protein B0I72DRAFT_102531 [Yarrowia lipolytica]|uniref:E3 ubiquitin-protein ligase listerin n=3 Tax=Yarrowia lipolytica TaxID=4952 RepID=Q6C4G2_YARLI|nr:YALI0E27049p [Yarrowia lipolytica CLIB122]KAB8281447.1 hypothetical protein BKA91DRAFT_159587 [Yarrowia lipolytica]KAE8175210.1 hypothetical protein BKA90DRAFT_165609 [Yarrowia lipolytica]KAJ8057424.1 hypothetical protein LXG23DRAFT_34309 [Yarrowia lipolytica]QNP99226.1 E3 ubiquitin-protein ligase listerin [Yarrowia lipolytica]RDW24047.1 hypothetical protein B0I71DRAFT_101930 [Yarrowia lipolytica]|eukprot:XP_504450.1 YALI0E27049p [Yarrowia lipolytica CLIB122]